MNDLGWGRAVLCAVCRLTVRTPAAGHGSPVSYPWDTNVLGSFSASERTEGERTPACPAPR